MSRSLPDALLAEAVSYFQANKGFHRLFELFKHKYRELGTIGGTVVLQNMLPVERDALTGFFRKDYTGRKSATVKLEKFQKALDSTRFGGLLLEDILFGYFSEEELVSNKERKTRYWKEREDFFRRILAKFEGTIAGEWLRHTLEEKNGAYPILIQRYDADRERLFPDIETVCRGLNQLPVLSGKKVRLPVFASTVSANPHAFDENTSCGQILLHAIAYQFGVGRPANAEEKVELYYAAGILYDEVSNSVLLNGLRACNHGIPHPGWEGFYACGEPLQVSLANLSSVDKVVSPCGKAYVLENAGVFAVVLDGLSQRKPPLICTYGQIRVSSLVLLDMLAKGGTKLFYSGDFDPEGLQIADKLKHRYGDRLDLWRYGISDYEKAVSHETISQARLKKMDRLKNPELVHLSRVILQSGRAGYQELILPDLIRDIGQSI